MEASQIVGQNRELTISKQEMAALEAAVNKEIPRLTMLQSIKYWVYEDWIYIFVTTKVLWKKLRIFGLQRLIRYTDPNTGILIVEDPGLRPESMKLMVEREREDLIVVEENFKRECTAGRFTMQIILPKASTINPVVYESRVKHYHELKTMLCKKLQTNGVMLDKLWIQRTMKLYQLKLTMDMLDERFVVRLLENNDMYKLEVCLVSENSFLPALESFPLLDNINDIITKVGLIRAAKEFPRIFQQSFSERFKLSESLVKEQPENIRMLGCWTSEQYGVTVEAKSDKKTFEIWVQLTHHYRQEVQQICMKFPYNPDRFVADFTVLLDRIRYLEEMDTVDPYLLFDAIESFKKAIKKERIVWDIKQSRWHLFSVTILDFPMPISISIGYNFVTERLDVSSILFHGESKNMKQIAELLGQGLKQLEQEWNSAPKPDELLKCKRIECPALDVPDIVEKILPEMKKYDVIMANRGNLYDTALYMGNGLILSMRPIGNYKQLQPEAHLLAHSFSDFVNNTEVIIIREENLGASTGNQIDQRLNTMPRQFIYYGFANNSDDIILRTRFGICGSLSTAFLFILLRYLMEKNLMEKELLEYIHNLVSARTDEARIAFMKDRQHSISKAVGRIKSTCSPQMNEILTKLDWLFEAFSE